MTTQMWLFCAAVCALPLGTAGTVSLEVPDADTSTYKNKLMFGYQGWFSAPDDGVRRGWWHWGRMDDPSKLPGVEMFPDMRECGSSEKYTTGYRMRDGTKASVFSSYNRATVVRHMKWVRDYGADGVFLQRFINEAGDKVVMRMRDATTRHIMEGSELYGRVFSIMYDGIGKRVETIKKDWMHLVDTLGITRSKAYLHHNGKPLVALWGYTVYEGATVEQAQELINWFKRDAPPQYRAAVKLGVQGNWLKRHEFHEVFRQADVISPWSVGGYLHEVEYDKYMKNKLRPGLDFCKNNGCLYVPVVWPGFSWHNLKGGKPAKNRFARKGGEHLWRQVHGAVSLGAQTLYVAMFDEVDESTAMFKTAETLDDVPTEQYWLTLDADGTRLPSDWYLRLAGKARQVLRKEIALSRDFGIPDEGIMTIYPDDNECTLRFVFPHFSGQDQVQISLDAGRSFAYSAPSSLRELRVRVPKGVFNVVARHPRGRGVLMGEVEISSDSCRGPPTQRGFNIRAQHSSMCLDVFAYSRKREAKVVQWPCNKRAGNQLWVAVPQRDSYFSLRVAHSNMCLDAFAYARNSGGRVVQWNCNGGDNQLLSLLPSGELRFKHSSKCLQIKRGDHLREAPLEQWDCGTNQQDQRFTFF